jgi:hypothetical protein
MTGDVAQMHQRMSSITPEQCSTMSSRSSPTPSGNAPSSRGNQLSSGFSFIDDKTTFCTQLQNGGFILEEYSEQASLYVSAVSDMIDIKDGTNAHCQSSSSFQHKECPLGHSVGASWHWVPHDDDGKDIILVLIVSQIFA